MELAPVVFGLDGLQSLIDVLADRGLAVFGPQVRGGVIAVRPLSSVEQLPGGWRDDQAPGRYRLAARDDRANFGWAVGPQTWKPLVHPPHVKTVTMTQHRQRETVHVEVNRQPPERRAFVGLRPCEVAAIARLDGVLLTDDRPEPVYSSRRAELFLVVVNCTSPAATCFCPSVGTGPGMPPAGGEDARVGAPPADVELTELLDDHGRPWYLARPRSDAGAEVLSAVSGRADVRTADPSDLRRETEALDAAVGAIERHLDTAGLPGALMTSLDHPHWDEIAARCLACGNCTAVCPTCFCTSVVDTGDLSGEISERWRDWGSCYDLEFSRVGPKQVRTSVAARYRQWLVHKLGTWHEQFGESGCVGCGRCITWCPAGIDLTAEVPVLRGAGATATVPTADGARR